MAANDNNDEKIPLGQRARALIEPALDDPKRKEWQYESLNIIFNKLAQAVPFVLERDLQQFEKSTAGLPPNQRHEFIVHNLTDGTPNTYKPMIQQPLPIFPNFLEFTAQEICEMDGYIKLHKVLRDHDCAIKITGLTAEETASGNGNPPVFTIDLMKSYEQGALENGRMYPNLPPKEEKPAPFNRQAGGDFSM